MRGALEVADIFRHHGTAYRDTHAGHLSLAQRRVMGAIEACRSATLGGHVEQCDDCGQIRIAYNWCRDRHCPKCQGLARAEWLADRQADLLPVEYFHVVFTVPAAIAEIAFQNKALVYAILFKAAAETLRIIAADPKHLGAEICLVAVLHTWGQNLHHHPHVHCVVPGGGPSADQTRWIGCRPGFFLPVKVLSRLYRRLFLTRLQAAFDAGQLRFFGDLARLDKPAMFTACPAAAACHSLGRLCQETPSAEPNRCSIISPVIPIASPSPTAVWSLSPTVGSASCGRTIATNWLGWVNRRRFSAPCACANCRRGAGGDGRCE